MMALVDGEGMWEKEAGVGGGGACLQGEGRGRGGGSYLHEEGRESGRGEAPLGRDTPPWRGGVLGPSRSRT